MKPSALTLIVGFAAALLVPLVTSCNSKSNQPQADTQATAALHGFPYPQIPNLLTDPAERRDYLLQHYWDNFDLSDTMLVLHTPDVTEQGLADYLSLLEDPGTADTSADAALSLFCIALHGHAEAQAYFVDKMNDYLFDANSPVYNEQCFARYLRCLMADTLIDEVHRQRFAPVLEVVSRNNPGMTATDFCYTTADGRLHTLLGTPAVADRLLLIFYDPDCEHCREVIAEMSADSWLADALAQRRLALLAVYTEGDETLWRETMGELPAGWQIGNDASTSIRGRLLYDLKAMPTIYLLDGEHTVLLKDPQYSAVKTFFEP